ncbi:MAG: hypothetical protein HQL41_07000 [Alphaproteobacteria bacterium]|nr:hypothetical protein [Alphaproteobacteria bacterium]
MSTAIDDLKILQALRYGKDWSAGHIVTAACKVDGWAALSAAIRDFDASSGWACTADRVLALVDARGWIGTDARGREVPWDGDPAMRLLSADLARRGASLAIRHLGGQRWHLVRSEEGRGDDHLIREVTHLSTLKGWTLRWAVAWHLDGVVWRQGAVLFQGFKEVRQ